MGGCSSLYTTQSPWGWAGAFSCWSRPLNLPREATTGELWLVQTTWDEVISPPPPFSLASIDCLHPSDKETEKKQSSIHCGVGLGRGVQKRKKENWGWMILCCLNLKLQLKLPIEGFFPPNNRRICVVIKYLLENYSQFFRQSMLNSTIFGEDSISLIALK